MSTLNIGPKQKLERVTISDANLKLFNSDKEENLESFVTLMKLGPSTSIPSRKSKAKTGDIDVLNRHARLWSNPWRVRLWLLFSGIGHALI